MQPVGPEIGLDDERCSAGIEMVMRAGQVAFAIMAAKLGEAPFLALFRERGMQIVEARVRHGDAEEIEQARHVRAARGDLQLAALELRGARQCAAHVETGGARARRECRGGSRPR